MGFTCTLYEGAEWCTHKGGQGPGWADFWPYIENFLSYGMNAKQACCGCGGGNTDNIDENYDVYKGLQAYPYGKVLPIWSNIHVS